MITQTKKTSLSIAREDVQMSDLDILKRYMGIDKAPCIVSSPLRDDDDTPSFSIFYHNNILCWKDFGTGESGSVIKLLAKLWHVNYKEALLKIKMDTEHKVPAFDMIRRYKGRIHLTSNSSMKVKVRPWKKWDIEFWEQFGISKKFATWCNVYPISHAFFTREEESGKKTTIAVPMDKYAYAYFEWKDGKESVKLYQPYSQTMKWLSKHDHSVWMTLGVPCMSLQGEGYIPKPQVMKQVLSTFKHIYLWYDNDFKHKNDNPGQDNARKLIEMYPSLINVCIPSKYKSKDPSDLYRDWGGDILKQVWNEFMV